MGQSRCQHKCARCGMKVSCFLPKFDCLLAPLVDYGSDQGHPDCASKQRLDRLTREGEKRADTSTDTG